MTNGAAAAGRPLSHNSLSNGHAPTPSTATASTQANLRGRHNLAPPLPLFANPQTNPSYNTASLGTYPQPETQRNGVAPIRPAQTQPVQNTGVPSHLVHPAQQQGQGVTVQNGLHEERCFSAQPLPPNNPTPQEALDEEEMDLLVEPEGDDDWQGEWEAVPLPEPRTDAAAPAVQPVSAAQQSRNITNPQAPATHIQQAGSVLPNGSNYNGNYHNGNHLNGNHLNGNHHNGAPSSLSQQPLILSEPTPDAAADFMNTYRTHMNSRSGQQQPTPGAATESTNTYSAYLNSRPTQQQPTPQQQGVNRRAGELWQLRRPQRQQQPQQWVGQQQAPMEHQPGTSRGGGGGSGSGHRALLYQHQGRGRGRGI